MHIRVIDTESTGLEATDHVVDIAAWDIVDGPAVAPWDETLVRPPVPIPPITSAIHHLIDSDVQDAPEWAQAWPAFVGPEVEVFAAHNARHDRQWLTDEICGRRPWIDTYRCALRIWPHALSHSNQALRYMLTLPGLNRAIAGTGHRAKADAYVTAHILCELLKKADVPHLIEWSSRPALLTRVNFGKHRGSPWASLPADYLKWVAAQADMNEDAKYTANHHLTELQRKAPVRVSGARGGR